MSATVHMLAGFDDDDCRDLANFAPALIRRLSLDRRCNWCSPAWSEFTGHSLDEQLGFGWTQSIHEDDAPRVMSALGECMARRESFTDRFRVRRQDGTWRWVADTGRFYESKKGGAGYFLVCVDVTEQMEQQVQLERALQDARMLRSELSHRVKNTLQLIISSLTLEGRKAEDGGESLRQAAQRIHAIGTVQDRLDALQSDGYVDLATFLSEVGHAVLDLRDDLRLQIEAPQEPIMLDTSRASAVGMLTMEAITNALKHAAGASMVSLKVERGADVYHVEICDDGCGFSAEMMEAARAKRSLGLLLFESLAAQAQGKVAVENRDGAVVRLTLPVRDGWER